MAFRPTSDSVVRGEIDNRQKSRVTFRLEFADGSVMTGDLKGNPYRDLAGRLLTFQNPGTTHGSPPEGLALEHGGHCGDITAARKVKMPPPGWTPAEPLDHAKCTWHNSLYLEWFSEYNGRVVLEAVDFEMSTSEPEWEMTPEEENQAHVNAANAMTGFFESLGGAEIAIDKKKKPSPEKEELDEFDWEQQLRESDRLTDRYMEALDKYGNDREAIDRAMGWNKRKEKSFDQPDWSEFEPDMDDFDEEAYRRDQEAAENHTFCKQIRAIMRKVKNSHGREHPGYFPCANVAAKLAGALSGYRADGTFDDNGFAIATLKRVLDLINEAHTAVPPDTAPLLLKLRSDIIDLQTELRKRG